MTAKFLLPLCIGLMAVAPVLAERPLAFDVPFDFTVGNQTWVAGKYQVSFPHSSTILLRSRTDYRSMIVITNSVRTKKPVEGGTLVFNRYGDRHFLSQILSPGYDQGRLLRPAKAEKEMARLGSPIQVAALVGEP